MNFSYAAVYYLPDISRLPCKGLVSPIYVFFNCLPRIKYVDSHQVHVLECAASHCKGKHGQDVRCFLDTGNVKSTSSLHQHAKMCWGDETISATDKIKDLDGTCAILAKSGLKRNGSITEAFEHIGKDKVTYLHCQHTYTETRYITHLRHNVFLTVLAGLKLSNRWQRVSTPLL